MPNYINKKIHKFSQSGGKAHLEIVNELWVQDTGMESYEMPEGEYRRLKNILLNLGSPKQDEKNASNINMGLNLCLMPDETKCDMIDSGAFNDIIIGYVKIAERTLSELKIKDQIPMEHIMPSIFDEYSAEEALATVRD